MHILTIWSLSHFLPMSDNYFWQIDVLLCLDCFHDGRFVAGHSSLDFVKVNSLKGYADLDGESWTDQETLLLLEGMQLYNENWNEIAEHVGTKSKAQCILHFVRLPVDITPLESIDVPSSTNLSNLPNGNDSWRSHSSTNGNLAVYMMHFLFPVYLLLSHCGPLIPKWRI